MLDAALADVRNAVGADALLTDAATCALAGQDVFSTGRPVAAVARPASVAAVQALVSAARSHRLALVPRGGGVSYTKAYLGEAPDRTIVVDMTGMVAIREINARDMYAVVEPGCTWQALEEALADSALEVPFRGTVSGRLATIGGGVAQNAVFYGSSLFGTAADNVIGLEIVTGSGEVIRTGSFAIVGGSPFLRHFGPDLTGLFTADCGAMGIKTAIVLKLRRRPAVRDVVSFTTPDIGTVFAMLEAVGQEGLAGQAIAMEAKLQSERVQQVGWRDRLRYVRSLVAGGGSIARKLGEGVALAREGLSAPRQYGMAVHAFVEGADAEECAHRSAAIARIASRLGLTPGNPAIGLAMVREPFAAVTGLAGGPGERWVPVHFMVPHSRAIEADAAIRAVLADHAGEIATQGIKVRHLLAGLGAGGMTLEPMFLWKDRLTDFARTTLVAQGGHAEADAPRRPEAEVLVARLRVAMIERLDALGAVHSQLGRAYPYLPRIAPETGGLFLAVRRLLDPDGIMNPGVLGTPPLDTSRLGTRP